MTIKDTIKHVENTNTNKIECLTVLLGISAIVYFFTKILQPIN